MSTTTEWIGALSNALLALSTIGLVCYAGRGLEEWKRERQAEWWNGTARDILVRGNAMHRICQRVMMYAIDDVVARHHEAHGRVPLFLPPTNIEQLLAEHRERYHEFMDAVYIGEFTWGQEIAAHYPALYAASDHFLVEVERLRSLAVVPYKEASEAIEEVVRRRSAIPDGAEPHVVAIWNCLQGISGTLKPKTHGTRDLASF